MIEGGGPLGRLITVIGRAARAGWAQTARMIALLTVAAAAAALVPVTSSEHPCSNMAEPSVSLPEGSGCAGAAARGPRAGRR